MWKLFGLKYGQSIGLLYLVLTPNYVIIEALIYVNGHFIQKLKTVSEGP